MIISDIHKYVCLQIPHTGSTSMGKWCRQNFLGKSGGTKHQSNIPKQYEKFYKFCLVRNPYKRIFTWWWFDKEKGNDVDFKTFIEFLIKRKDIQANDPGLKNPRFYMNQTSWIKETNCNWLRLEDIIKNQKKELLKLPFVTKSTYKPFPHYNKTKTRPNMDIKTYFKHSHEYIDLIHEYCFEDFATFGYCI